ncbi:MAG TPA: hypothetical protein DEF45_06330 [Rhodopirellula sp.]|nr:hypothetical protein [Rhodopirellula sp.]
MTLMIVTGWLVINLLIFFTNNSLGDANSSLSDHPKTQITTDANLASPSLVTTQGQSWIAGTVFGLISFISWLATSISNSFIRFATRITAAVGCVLLLTVCCTPDMLRHAIGVSGILLVQPIIFVLLAIPCWTTSLSTVGRRSGPKKKTEASQQPKLPQFHVGELITVTTLVALLLAASRQYTPPVASLIYWPVLICSWFFLQTIAALTIRVVMFRQLRLLVFLLPVILITTWGLAKVEGLASEGLWQADTDLRLYSILISGFTLSITVLCSSDGRETLHRSIDAKKSRQHQALT